MAKEKKQEKTPGKKTVMTTETIKKLVAGFKQGLSVRECAAFADVSKTAIYDFLSENTEFKDRVKTLQWTPKMLAKLVVVAAIQAGDAQISMWYLERELKRKTERERQRLMRMQRRTLEMTNKVEALPDAIVDLAGHWSRVDKFFRGEYTEPKKQDGEPKQ